MLFRGCSVVEHHKDELSPSFLPHNTSEDTRNGYAEPSSGRAYAVETVDTFRLTPRICTQIIWRALLKTTEKCRGVMLANIVMQSYNRK